jgi:hypothetical protein
MQLSIHYVGLFKEIAILGIATPPDLVTNEKLNHFLTNRSDGNAAR